jgi:signal transduction histidine kinase
VNRRLRTRTGRWLLDPGRIFFASFAIVSLVLVIVVVTSIVTVGRINDSSKRTFVRQALPVTAQVRGLLLALVNEETSVRGYVITGDPRNLEPYREGRAMAAADLAALDRFSRSHPEFGPPLRQARREIAAIDRYFRTEIALVNLGYPGQLRAQFKVDQGRVLFERFRKTADRIDALTAAFVRRAEHDQDRTYDLSMVALGLLGGLGVLLSIVILVLGPSRMRRLYSQLERGARASLAIDHVGDAVVLVAADGDVLYANAATHAMLGVEGPFPPLHVLRPRIERAVSESGPEVTIPVESDDGSGGERWLSVVAVRFDGGTVYRLRDVTQEHELEQLRSDFVATASHELRTPVSAVYGAAETLRRRDVTLDESTRERLLEVISGEASSLAEIVDQILLTNELDARRTTVVRRPVDPVRLAESVVDAAASKAPGNIEFALNKPDGHPAAPLLTDETRLRQILVNLVENAVKYSPEGGRVDVGVRRDGERVAFEVRDQGIGISSEDRDRIFEKFFRADPSMSRGVGGTGLGLYIVHELVERLGGEIEVVSAPGRGTSFKVDLPVS